MKMKKRDNDVILLMTEMAASLAAKDVWEKKYKEALKGEDERIACIVAEEEAQRKKLLDIKTEFHATREAMINKVVKKFMDNVCKKREEIPKKLYQKERKWIMEPATFASRKQYAIAESLKETTKRQKAIAQRTAKNKMIDAAFARYLSSEK